MEDLRPAAKNVVAGPAPFDGGARSHSRAWISNPLAPPQKSPRTGAPLCGKCDIRVTWNFLFAVGAGPRGQRYGGGGDAGRRPRTEGSGVFTRWDGLCMLPSEYGNRS
jgi:hypothetical protein